MSGRRDIGVALSRALAASAAAAGCPIEPVRGEWRHWASATFVGARHNLTISAPASPALDSWLAGLAEADFALAGHLVADLVVKAVRREGETVEVEIEALTVESR